VTVEYDRASGKPLRVDAVVVSAHHAEGIDQARIRDDLRQRIIDVVCGQWMDDRTRVFVNPTGAFTVGGPKADAGMTGRKIIVDTYGGSGFSGKDPSKVDRSGAYQARSIAKHVVAAGLADRCEVQLAYAIGVAERVSAHVNAFGTARVPEDQIEEAILRVFDSRPGAIIEHLRLLKPPFRYRELAAGGHMGRNPARLGMAWERTDDVERLLKEIRG